MGKGRTDSPHAIRRGSRYDLGRNHVSCPLACRRAASTSFPLAVNPLRLDLAGTNT